MSESTAFTAERVILRLLQLVKKHVGRPLHRTHLVKLVFLGDYVFSRHTGRTLTGFQYMWDNFGPNAVGNQIVKRADQLDLVGAIHITEGQNPSGSFKFLYEAVDAFPDLPLGGLAEEVLIEVVSKYGGLDWRAAVVASKKTPPFQNAKQGDLLDLGSPRAGVERVFEEIQRRETLGQYDSPGRGLTLEEVKSRYGLAG